MLENLNVTAEYYFAVPPSWIVEPQNLDAKLGQNVVLDCQVEGFPKPLIAWKKALGMSIYLIYLFIMNKIKNCHKFQTT